MNLHMLCKHNKTIHFHLQGNDALCFLADSIRKYRTCCHGQREALCLYIMKVYTLERKGGKCSSRALTGSRPDFSRTQLAHNPKQTFELYILTYAGFVLFYFLIEN